MQPARRFDFCAAETSYFSGELRPALLDDVPRWHVGKRRFELVLES